MSLNYFFCHLIVSDHWPIAGLWVPPATFSPQRNQAFLNPLLLHGILLFIFWWVEVGRLEVRNGEGRF